MGDVIDFWGFNKLGAALGGEQRADSPLNMTRTN
jgi:hypothetical protein